MSAVNDLKILDDLNDTLDKIIVFAEDSFSTIEDLEGKTQDLIQEEVDKICEKVSKKGTEKLNLVRDKTVKTLHNKYVSANEIIALLKPIVTASFTDLNGVISILKKIVSLYLGPYNKAMTYIADFTVTATPKLATTVEKTDKIIGLKDSIPIPEGFNINFDKLNISMKPITIDEIING